MAIVDLLLNTARSDTDLLIENDGQGDVFTSPRQVDFFFRAPTKEKADLVANFINDNRYGEASAEMVELEHVVKVLILMPITQNLICSVSGLMACLGEIFDVEYDGWGSVIQRNRQ